MHLHVREPVPTARLRTQDADLQDFRALIEVESDPAAYPNASELVHEVAIYQPDDLQSADRIEILDELADVLVNGPGILVVRSAIAPATIDRVNLVYAEIIAEQHAAGGAAGDHFAVAGANDRIWNTLEKLCLRDPETFADYYQSDAIALVCTAFLGPRYQVSAQANQVNPGGAAQNPHRDYHLGFLTDEQAVQFPGHVHQLSSALTLQGAVAHVDMPVETGPTMYLPHSQKYLPGYIAYRRPEFMQYFQENYVQLALGKGDLVFFNPALFHAAGTNTTTDVLRMGNLLQVSSAFGRLMERIDRTAMVMELYPILQRWKADGAAPGAIANVIASSAEGYAFPNNLDLDQPLDGLAPESMADQVHRALAQGWNEATLRTAIAGDA